MQAFLENYGWVVLVAGILLVAWTLGKLLLPGELPPYDKRPSLLTEAERKFFHALREAVDGAWSLQAMVRLADILQVRQDAPQRQAWTNRILAKHLDFVLCDHDRLDMVLAIELDDKTHDRKDRQQRDRFVNDALAAARLPLLRVPVSDSYDPAKLREKIDALVG